MDHSPRAFVFHDAVPPGRLDQSVLSSLFTTGILTIGGSFAQTLTGALNIQIGGALHLGDKVVVQWRGLGGGTNIADGGQSPVLVTGWQTLLLPVNHWHDTFYLR